MGELWWTDLRPIATTLKKPKEPGAALQVGYSGDCIAEVEDFVTRALLNQIGRVAVFLGLCGAHRR